MDLFSNDEPVNAAYSPESDSENAPSHSTTVGAVHSNCNCCNYEQ